MSSHDGRQGHQTGLVPLPGLRPGTAPDRDRGTSADHPRQPGAMRSSPAGQPATQEFPVPVTGQLIRNNVTRVLTAPLPVPGEGATSRRMPVIIKASLKRPSPVPIPPLSVVRQRHRVMIRLVGIALLVLILAVALFSVTPLGREMGLNSLPLSGSGILTGPGSDLSNPVAQATATAIYHQRTDGYSGGNAQVISDGTNSLLWPLGQCTFWANLRYHELTGYWIPWRGNANQWVAGARAAGWHVSTTPHVPSIIVLMGTQGANGYYGHVAVVEGVAPGTHPPVVHTSNMNWYSNGGGWDRVSSYDFTTGPGTYFIWHP